MASQAIKYENTEVSADKSATELQAIVRKYGGTRFEMRWKDGLLVGVRFAIQDKKLGEIPVMLKAKTENIRAILEGKKKGRSYYLSDTQKKWCAEQSYRIAWRQLKDVTEQLLLGVHTGLFTLTDAFMSSLEVYDPATGEPATMGELFYQRAQLAPGGEMLLLNATTEH